MRVALWLNDSHLCAWGKGGRCFNEAGAKTPRKSNTKVNCCARKFFLQCSRGKDAPEILGS